MIGMVPLDRLSDLDRELRDLAEEALKQAGWQLDWLVRAYRPPAQPQPAAVA